MFSLESFDLIKDQHWHLVSSITDKFIICLSYFVDSFAEIGVQKKEMTAVIIYLHQSTTLSFLDNTKRAGTQNNTSYILQASNMISYFSHLKYLRYSN